MVEAVDIKGDISWRLADDASRFLHDIRAPRPIVGLTDGTCEVAHTMIAHKTAQRAACRRTKNSQEE